MTNTRCSARSTARRAIDLRGLLVLFAIAMCAAIPARAQQTDNEKAVWKLESSYWEYVKALDLDRYKELWHPNFVGWPSTNGQPARKDQITGWIAAHTEKGERMQWFSLQPAASQATENIVVTHYWLTAFWQDKAGRGEPSTSRITHTWIKTAGGWQIVGGMSAPVPAN